MSWSYSAAIHDFKVGKIGSPRRFGIELEVSRATRFESLQGQTPFGCKRDNSVNGSGLEFYSPILQGDDGLKAVETLCGYAKSNGWEADASCGFHVHVDVSDLDDLGRRQAIAGYLLTGDIWQNFIHPLRRNNNYCKSTSPVTLDTVKRCSTDTLITYQTGRYYWLNLHSLVRHRTLELRLHEGTLDFNTIAMWIKAHLRFVDYASKQDYATLEAQFGGVQSKAARFRNLETIWADRDISVHFQRITKGHGAPIVMA